MFFSEIKAFVSDLFHLTLAGIMFWTGACGEFDETSSLDWAAQVTLLWSGLILTAGMALFILYKLYQSYKWNLVYS